MHVYDILRKIIIVNEIKKKSKIKKNSFIT